jgi:hypothetical protein
MSQALIEGSGTPAVRLIRGAAEASRPSAQTKPAAWSNGS